MLVKSEGEQRSKRFVYIRFKHALLDRLEIDNCNKKFAEIALYVFRTQHPLSRFDETECHFAQKVVSLENVGEVLDQQVLCVLLLHYITQHLNRFSKHPLVLQHLYSQLLYIFLSFRSPQHILQQVGAKVFTLIDESRVFEQLAQKVHASLVRLALSEKLVNEVEAFLLNVGVLEDLSDELRDVVLGLLPDGRLFHPELLPGL